VITDQRSHTMDLFIDRLSPWSMNTRSHRPSAIALNKHKLTVLRHL